VGAPKALLETPKGGDNIVAGIGLFNSGINSARGGGLWQSSENSLMDDVRSWAAMAQSARWLALTILMTPCTAADPDPENAGWAIPLAG